MLKDIFNDNAFALGLNNTDKKSMVEEMAHFFASVYNMDKDTVFNALWAREEKGSTGLGKGLAIPHARVKGIGSIKIAVFYTKEGSDFEAYDNLPTHLFFVAMIDEDAAPQEPLEMLKMIVETSEDKDLVNALANISSTDELKNIIMHSFFSAQNQ
ncbi:MAG: PTS sugar transporter subunit IIA [Brevinema sp.]